LSTVKERSARIIRGNEALFGRRINFVKNVMCRREGLVEGGNEGWTRSGGGWGGKGERLAELEKWGC